MEYTAEKGCRTAQSDGHHDFDKTKKLTNLTNTEITAIINDYIPQNSKYKDCGMSEDEFFKEYILDSNDPKMLINSLLSPEDNTSEITDINNKFKSDIKNKYIVFSVKRSSIDEKYKIYHPPNNSKNNKSFIEEILKRVKITNDIFFIGDTSDPNIMDDLASVQDTNFYWVQNAQTLYDPAGKTAYHTNAGIDYGFRNPNSKFTFCWEKYDSGCTIYPHWNEDKSNQAVERETINEDNQEIMFYTNRDIYMAIEKKDINKKNDDYQNHDSGILITYPKTKGLYAYANSNLAEINSSLLNDDNYVKKSEMLKNLIANLIQNKESAVWKKLQEKNWTNKMLAKRLGDSGQSLSCLRKKIKLQRFEKKDKSDKIVDFESNNFLAFISFDKLAIAFSILYGTPIIIQSIREEQGGIQGKSSGFIVYIRKDLLDPVKSIHTNYTTDVLAQNIQKFKDIDMNLLQLQNVKTNMDRFTGFLQQIVANNDNGYSSLMTVYMKYINVFYFLKIIQLKEIDFNKQIITKKLVDILNFSVNSLNKIMIEIKIKNEEMAIDAITDKDIDTCFLTDTKFIQNKILSKINSYIDEGQPLHKYAKDINSIISDLNGNLSSLFESYEKQIDVMIKINEILQTIPDRYSETTIREMKIQKDNYSPYHVLCYGRDSTARKLDEKLDSELQNKFGKYQIESIFRSFDYNSYGKKAYSHFVKQIQNCITYIKTCKATEGSFATTLATIFEEELDKIGFFMIPEEEETNIKASEVEIDKPIVNVEKKDEKTSPGMSVKKKSAQKSQPKSTYKLRSLVTAQKSQPKSTYRLRSREIKGGAGSENLNEFITKIFSLTPQDISIIQQSIDEKNINMKFPKFNTIDNFYRSLYDFEIFLKGFMRILVMIKTDEVAIRSNKLDNTLPFFTFNNNNLIMKNIFNYLYSIDENSIDKYLSTSNTELKEYVAEYTNNKISICYNNVAEKLFSSNKFTIQRNGKNININEAIYQYINYEDERLTPEKKQQLNEIFGERNSAPGLIVFPFPKEIQQVFNILIDMNKLQYIKIVLNGIMSYGIANFKNLKDLIESRSLPQKPSIFSSMATGIAAAPVSYKNIYQKPVASVFGGKTIKKKSKNNKKTNRKTRKKCV